jgi:FkbM family methyltransferase
VSYAQNGEDIVLARGLLDSDGFYVDIGAFDPHEDSVTKMFYERGWRGVNVDPIPEVMERFERDRPRDINVQAAISAEPGDAELWTGPPGLIGHSTLDAEIARAHIDDGVEFTRSTVRTMRLDSLLDEFVPAGTVVDFLKVDVEGHERAVLESCDWTRWRPRVVVVECMAPYVEGSTHESWEPILLAAGYVTTLFDGLNRFYVLPEETELVAALSAPASVVDEFERSAVRDLRVRFAELQHAEAEAQRLKIDLEQSELKVAAMNIGLGELSQLLAENVERQRALTIEIDRRDVLLADAEGRLGVLESKLDEMREQEAKVRAELDAIQRTKVFRYARLPRQLYGRVFRR